MHSQPSSTPVQTSATILPCYFDPFRDCSEQVDSVTNGLVKLAAGLVGVGFGILYVYLVLFA